MVEQVPSSQAQLHTDSAYNRAGVKISQMNKTSFLIPLAILIILAHAYIGYRLISSSKRQGHICHAH